MLAKSNEEFVNFFHQLDDIRQDEKVLFPLDEILFLVLAAVLSCAESWESIVEYGEQKLDFLRKYFPYAHGIPSKSTVCTVIGMIDKNKFEQWFSCWAFGLANIIPEELIAIDGKTICGSKSEVKRAAHVLNAFATTRGIIIAQRTIGDKTNEITEIPALLDHMNIKNSVISIDAMGCQKKITNKIIEKGAEYFLALKGNNETLEAEAKYLFTQKEGFDFHEEHDKGHGRVETRRCWSTSAPEWFKSLGFQALNSIVMVECERHIKDTMSIEQRLYITSLPVDATKHLGYSRQHWLVENSVHWVLDVTFKEDACQIKNAAENMSLIRKIIMNLLREYKVKTRVKSSLNGLRMSAGWSEEIAAKIISGLFI